MTKQLMFYEEATPISKERHADISVRSGTDYSFAKNVNSVPVTAVGNKGDVRSIYLF